MGHSKNSKYNGKFREFICKRCGNHERIPMHIWIRKPQNKKNICSDCIKKELISAQTAEEKAMFARY